MDDWVKVTQIALNAVQALAIAVGGGWVYFKLGQYGPAEESLRKAIERTTSGEKYQAPDGSWKVRTATAPTLHPSC